MSWVEVDGAGWSWVHGLVIPIGKQSYDIRHLCVLGFLQLSQENTCTGVFLKNMRLKISLLKRDSITDNLL